MRREWLLSIGAVALAFLGAQHHNLIMLLLALGFGEAGMSVMMHVPWLRAVMLVMSLAMVVVVGYQISKPRRPLATRVVGGLSILVTLGVAGWSVLHVGL